MTTMIPEDYPYEVCRDMAHAWSRETVLSLSPDGRILERTTHCQDCPVKRVERFGVSRGRVVTQYHSRYKYPKNPPYLIKGGASRRDFRFARLNAALKASK